MVDLNKADSCTNEVWDEVSSQYKYHPWSPEKIDKGIEVRKALEHAARIIISNVPPCPDRSVALRKLREARMDCNSAITHDGKY